MATGSLGGHMLSPTTVPGTPVAPTSLTGVSAAAGPGKGE